MVCAFCATPVPAGTVGCPSCGRAPVKTATQPVDNGAFGIATRTLGGPPHASSKERLTVGELFGARYRIIRLLGVGGMGAVYQAWDEELSVAVALKVIRQEARRGSASAEAEKRFKTELLLARQVTHKNVVRIHDLGEIDGIKYISMPYIKGDDLATVLRRDGRLPLERALHLMRQIAAGLASAHEAGVVHRDLKPANVMIGVDDQAWILDFGISASTADAAAGELIGTPEYMAPEQGLGNPVDARADVYAFGLIGYELLVGLRPLPDPYERLEAMRLRCELGLPALSSFDQSIPVAVDQLITRCLATDPAARFQSAVDICAALERIDDAGEIVPEPRRLTPRIMAIAGLVLVVLVAGTSILTRRAVSPPKQHDPVSVLIADLQNQTGDSAFDGTLEPMLKRALEGASFISAYDRSAIRGTLGLRPPETLDEQAALEMAVKQGVGVVLSGSLNRQGSGYGISVRAVQPVSGEVITRASGRAPNKDQVLGVTTNLVASVRKALGDDTSDSAQLFAMQTLSATSLDVVRHFARALDASTNNKFDEAFQAFSKAVEIDPKFGAGYVGMAAMARNLGRPQDADRYIKEALRYLDGMTERERFNARGMLYIGTGDYQQCVKEYGDLVARYAADVYARNRIALCSTYLRDMQTAVSEMREVVKLVPKRAIFRVNLALYESYGGDFRTGEQEARAAQELGSPLALLPLALAQVGQEQLAQAGEAYRALGKAEGLGSLGASLAASGLGDVATYEGRFSDAVRILDDGAAADLGAKNADRAAAKFASLAYAYLSRGQIGPAVVAADKALTNSQSVKIRFLAGRIFVETNQLAKAKPLIAGLASKIQAEPQAHAKILEGDLLLKNGNPRQALKPLTEANGLLDTWIGHFDLGRAYLEAGMFAQADSEFDRCIKRRGEALALFIDEEPTYGYLPAVYYYQGRAREGLKTEGFANSYREYLRIRGASKEDPLLRDVNRRVTR